MAVCRHGAEYSAVEKRQASVRRSTKPMRFFQDRVEDRREIARRGVDDLQDLGDCGFPRQRLVALALEIGNDLLRIV